MFSCPTVVVGWLVGLSAIISHWHFTLTCDYYSTFSLSLNIWLLFSEPQRRITNTFEWEKDMTRNKKLTFGKRGKENNGKLKKTKQDGWRNQSTKSAVCCYPLNQLFAATLWISCLLLPSETKIAAMFQAQPSVYFEDSTFMIFSLWFIYF